MKTTKLSTIMSAVLAATISSTAFAGHHEAKIDTSFNAMDTNSDGFIVASEVEGTLEAKTLAMMDTDGDNMVSRNEFSTFVDEKPSMFSDEIITKVKTTSTTDAVLIKRGDVALMEKADGEMISEKNKELRTEMSAMADDRFTQIDTNSDGKLTTKEIEVAEIQGDFDEMDDNDDQVITRMEYRAYFEEIESE
ncbi:MAG: hypothetical protein VX061_05430 [Pseudomonadota bacterium]|nr:hypothetical protein [Pseudomonadota bacterium]